MSRSFPYIAFAVAFTAILIWYAWAVYRSGVAAGADEPVNVSRLYARQLPPPGGVVRERGINAVR